MNIFRIPLLALTTTMGLVLASCGTTGISAEQDNDIIQRDSTPKITQQAGQKVTYYLASEVVVQDFNLYYRRCLWNVRISDETGYVREYMTATTGYAVSSPNPPACPPPV